jgi:hypothetical protein
MAVLSFSHAAILASLLLLIGETQSFYLPGVNPQSFAEGDT